LLLFFTLLGPPARGGRRRGALPLPLPLLLLMLLLLLPPGLLSVPRPRAIFASSARESFSDRPDRDAAAPAFFIVAPVVTDDLSEAKGAVCQPKERLASHLQHTTSFESSAEFENLGEERAALSLAREKKK
jgi:hypothetical protein